MTSYYYVASDQELGSGSGSLEFIQTESQYIPGFDYLIQKEIYNGVEKLWELRELLQYIRNHMIRHKSCTVQVAHLINSNHVELKVRNTSCLSINEIVDPKQLLLSPGELLTITHSSTNE